MCHADAPEDLKANVAETTKLSKWVKSQDVDTLIKALDWIWIASPDIRRDIVRGEIKLRQHAEIIRRGVDKEATEARRHATVDEHFRALREPHWTTTPTFWLVLLSIAIGLTSCVISWLAWKRPVSSGVLVSPVGQGPLKPASTPEPSSPPQAQIQSNVAPSLPIPETPLPVDAPKAPAPQENKPKPKIINSEP
jgi:hypothetical protein